MRDSENPRDTAAPRGQRPSESPLRKRKKNTKPVFTYVLGECVYHFPGLNRLSLAIMSHTNRQTNIYVGKIGISSDGRSPKVDFDKFFPL